MLRGLCKCGVFTNFLWRTREGEKVFACSAKHAGEGAKMVESEKFEEQRFRLRGPEIDD